MIKLKKLIKEAAIQSSVWWKSPDGTPDQVITILHHIRAQILKKGKDCNDYIALRSYKKGGEVYWEITNKKASDRGLVYKEKEQSWYSTGALKAPLNPIILNAFIKRWVVDVMGESRIPTYRWETPDGTPDDVVKVFHWLAAASLKKHEDPKKSLALYHDPDVKDWPFPAEDTWMIVNVGRPSDSIYYNSGNGTWYSHVDGDHFEPMTAPEVKMSLQNWGQ
jgi:hypothetical protein